MSTTITTVRRGVGRLDTQPEPIGSMEKMADRAIRVRIAVYRTVLLMSVYRVLGTRGARRLPPSPTALVRPDCTDCWAFHRAGGNAGRVEHPNICRMFNGLTGRVFGLMSAGRVGITGSEIRSLGGSGHCWRRGDVQIFGFRNWRLPQPLYRV